ncbi:MAG: SulP family inorganic anion transporter [Saprospiraceae bacterium]|nr:SulP family inorganic anion transporter [Saprospiraceae bacterium]
MKKTSNLNLPLDGINGLKENFSSDILSGFIVSLLALPLSLGIATASDFPNPMYGVLTAIIGGMLVSLISGSVLTIKGAAAGLIVICAGSVAAFGGGEAGWHMTLGVIVVAALLQILFGVLKLGKLSDFFPLSAIHGMLAAIGLIIISKQLHILLGVNPLNEEGKPLIEPLELIGALPSTLAKISSNMPIVVTGIVSLLIVLFVPLIKSNLLKKIPVPMIVLIVSIPLAQFLGLGDIKGALLKFDKPFLDIIKVNVSFGGFSQIGVFIQYVILFAIIGSLESLLTAKAIDLLDPYRRKSDFNKDLMAVGAGNLLAGVLGGLPMISEVARSSANVNNKAKTRWANFFHGLFLLLFMLFLIPIIQLIPKAALAALLIGVGIKLTHPNEYINAFKIGREQFIVFIVTVIFTLGVDLLVGIAAGIATEFIINLIHGKPLSKSFRPSIDIEEEYEGEFLVKVYEAAVFSNFMGIKNKLYAIPHGRTIYIDFQDCHVIDHSAMENLHHFEHDYEESGGTVEIIGLDEHESVSNHKLAARKKRKLQPVQ